MARETWPAMLSSVTRVWRLSCHQPLHAGVLADLCPRRLERRDRARRIFGQGRPECEYEPFWPALPEPPRVPGGVPLGAIAVSLSGITRPVPASVFDLPAVSAFLWIRSICSRLTSHNSLSRRPVFKSSVLDRRPGEGFSAPCRGVALREPEHSTRHRDGSTTALHR